MFKAIRAMTDEQFELFEKLVHKKMHERHLEKIETKQELEPISYYEVAKIIAQVLYGIEY